MNFWFRIGFASCAVAMAVTGCSEQASENEDAVESQDAGAVDDVPAEPDKSAAQANAQASPALTIAQRYDRAVECAATAMGLYRVYSAVATATRDSDPDRASQAEQRAENTMQDVRTFARIAESLGADPAIGKSTDAVLRDMEAMNSQIQARSRQTDDFTAFATSLGRETDNCQSEREAIQYGEG